MGSLKVSFSLTIFSFFLLAMLLANGLTLIFWHASIVHGRVDRAQSSLSVAVTVLAYHADEIDANGELILANMIEAGKGACGALQLNEYTKKIGPTACSASLWQHRDDDSPVFTHNPLFSFLSPKAYIFIWRKLEGGQPGKIGLALSMNQIWDNILQQEKILLAYIVVNSLIFGVLVFFRMRRLILKPIDRLVDFASQYGASGKEVFLPRKGHGEFSQLTTALHSMTSRIKRDHKSLELHVGQLKDLNSELQQTRADMIKAERLAAIGQLTAGLAHEIGNPLGAVLGYVGLLKRGDVTSAEHLDYVQRIEDELERINHLVRQLLSTCRKTMSDEEKGRVNVHKIVSNVLNLVQGQHKEQINFSKQCDAEYDTVLFAVNELHQVLLNCLLNAVDSFVGQFDNENNHIIITTRNLIDDTTLFVEINIIDTGVGMEEGVLEKATEPFFTTKAVGKGTGLGLSVSSAILEREGGSLKIQSSSGAGTVVSVRVPVVVK